MTGRERPKPAGKTALTWRFVAEGVTGIEPALSAWESVPSGPLMRPDLRGGMSASDRERPLVAGVNGLLMARRTRRGWTAGDGGNGCDRLLARLTTTTI